MTKPKRGQNGGGKKAGVAAGIDRPKMFAKEYCVDYNGTAAAERCGYSPASASSMSSQLLKRHDVQQYIRDFRRAAEERCEISVDRITQELAAIAFARVEDLTEPTEDGVSRRVVLGRASSKALAAVSQIETEEIVLTGSEGEGDVPAGASLRKIKTKFKMHDKAQALNNLGKHLGMFKETHEFLGADGKPLPMAPLMVQFVDVETKKK